MGGKTDQKTTSEPWKAAKPYLTGVMKAAKNTYDSGEGFSPFPDSTVAQYGPQTTDALGNIENRARQVNHLAASSQDQAQGILDSGGMSDYQRQGMQGTFDVATGGGPLGEYASGAHITGGSPQFNAALDRQAGKLTDDISRGTAMEGRSGSAYHANAIGDNVGAFRNSALANEIKREQAMQMQAQGMQMGAGSAINQAGGQAADNVARFAGMAPGIYGQQFTADQRLAGVGAAYEGKDQQNIQDAMARWGANQQQDWRRLGAYAGLVSPMGGQGGVTTQSAPGGSPFGSALGGAMAGAQVGSAIPGMGTALGAIGGGLAGWLGN
jgi:hypothetical protein